MIKKSLLPLPGKKYNTCSALIAAHLFAIFCLLATSSCNSGAGNGSRPASTDTIQRKETANPFSTNDQSPMDMAYFPTEYPILKMNGSADSFALVARVLYSRPQKKGREIFGSDAKALCQYGKEWRLGANEATEIEFFRDVIIGTSKVAKGRYVIYCVPYTDHWTIILNSNLFTWGLHMDPTKDLVKTDIPASSQAPPLEDFTMAFQKAAHGVNLVMAWDQVKAELPIKVVL